MVSISGFPLFSFSFFLLLTVGLPPCGWFCGARYVFCLLNIHCFFLCQILLGWSVCLFGVFLWLFVLLYFWNIATTILTLLYCNKLTCFSLVLLISLCSILEHFSTKGGNKEHEHTRSICAVLFGLFQCIFYNTF